MNLLIRQITVTDDRSINQNRNVFPEDNEVENYDVFSMTTPQQQPMVTT